MTLMDALQYLSDYLMNRVSMVLTTPIHPIIYWIIGGLFLLSLLAYKASSPDRHEKNL